MDEIAVKDCLTDGINNCMPLLLQGNVTDMYMNGQDAREEAGASAAELEDIILADNPPDEIDADAEMASVPKVQAYLKCSEEAAQDYVMYYILSQIAVGYLAARITAWMEDSLENRRHQRDTRNIMLDIFADLSGLSAAQCKSIMTQFDGVFDKIAKSYFR